MAIRDKDQATFSIKSFKVKNRYLVEVVGKGSQTYTKSELGKWLAEELTKCHKRLSIGDHEMRVTITIEYIDKYLVEK